jgi:hypothetical protein
MISFSANSASDTDVTDFRERGRGLRQYYGGTNFPSFYDSLKSNWAQRPFLYLLQVFRALLFVGCAFPLIRMLRVSRWERAAAVALFLSAWTTILLFPSPLMPVTVARSHFWETLVFSLTFGTLLGWLLDKSDSIRATGFLRIGPH